MIAKVVELVGIALIVILVVVVVTRGDDETAEQFFDHHRTDLDRVAELVAAGKLVIPADVDSYYYGPWLPADLRYLSETGRVSIYSDGSFFIPRWTGIPDDAGGYWYSTKSPEGRDMYGLGCADPIDLGSHWWACGM